MFRVTDFHNISEYVRERAQSVKVLITDVDGVLTNGQISYSSDGSETKTFHVQDGLGAKLLQKAGVQVVVLTGRKSEVVARRCEELGISPVFQGVSDKKTVLAEFMKKEGLQKQEVAYIGDDVNDRESMTLTGLTVCPADAHQVIKRLVDYITWKKGGQGAFRELADLILTARNIWR